MRVVVVSTVHALTRFPIVLLYYLAAWTVTLVITLTVTLTVTLTITLSAAIAVDCC